MREIKFRQWDRKKKQFATCCNGGNGISFSLDYKGVNSLCSEPFKLYSQFTGLKDKNGKEIYEGDIVRVTQPDTDTTDAINMVGDVKYERNRFYVDCPHYHPEFETHTYEVIGNIYENPELLGEG